MTTTAALQGVEQGRLNLDATVASILPAFGQLQLLEGFDGEKPRLRPPDSAATVRQRMTHTAGPGDFFTNEKLQRQADGTLAPSVQDLPVQQVRLAGQSCPPNRWTTL